MIKAMGFAISKNAPIFGVLPHQIMRSHSLAINPPKSAIPTKRQAQKAEEKWIREAS